ncbi:MAG: hypothetical protein ACR2NZ_04715 [Rubripirellula sp.]
MKQNRISILNHRLSELETQIERLTDLLSEQASSKQRRRRRLTLRAILIAVVGFALLFAWFGTVYRQSLRQSFAVDHLIDQSAFVHYTPRQSALVSLLPGDPQSPSASLVDALGDDFFRSVTNVSTGRRATSPRDKQEILEALEPLHDLQRLRLTNLQLTTEDLRVLEGLGRLQSLDVSRTRLDSAAMSWMRKLPLRWFDASHTYFGDRALATISNCPQLQELRLERTCVTDEGLKYLHGMPNLRYLNLKRCPVSQGAVQQLSDALPGCYIEWEPLRFLANGKVDAQAASRGRVRFGRRAPADPREWRRASPPIDKRPSSSRPSSSRASGFNGYVLDVF